jgi:4'-phosphopantetheinyl transferase
MRDAPKWQARPALISIGQEDVHLWRCIFRPDMGELRRFEALLDNEEMARANRFLKSIDRDHFTYYHGVLRIILSEYTKTSARFLEFDHNRYGKPELRRCLNYESVKFNLSHSQDMAVIGVTLNREIGVDVEYKRPIEQDKYIAINYFSESESALLSSLNKEDFEVAFLAYWTLKEASAKAIGKGLSMPLDQFAVSLEVSNSLLPWVKSGEVILEFGRWHYRSLTLSDAYIGALVAEPFSRINLYDFG